MALKTKPNIINVTVLTSAILTLACSYSSILFAAESSGMTNANISDMNNANINVSTAEPSLEFLMYLGEWQDNSGQSINPENLESGKISTNKKSKPDDISVINTKESMKPAKPDNNSLLPEKEK